MPSATHCTVARCNAAPPTTIQAHVVEAAHTESPAVQVRRDDALGSCENRESIAQCSEPPYARSGGDNHKSNSGVCSAHLALENSVDEEEDEGDNVVDELDLYCSTPAFLYPRPTTVIIPSSTSISSTQRSTEEAIPAEPRALDAVSPTRALSSSNVSALVDDTLRHQNLERLTDARRVVGTAPSGLKAVTLCDVHHAGGDASGPGVDYEQLCLVDLLETWDWANNLSSGQSDGVMRHVSTPVAPVAQQSNVHDHSGVHGDASMLVSSSTRLQDQSLDSGDEKAEYRHGAEDDECGASKGHVVGPDVSVHLTTAAKCPASPPVSGVAEGGPHVSSLISDFDLELLEIIRDYYVHKELAGTSSTPPCPSPPPAPAHDTPRENVATPSIVAPTHGVGSGPNQQSSRGNRGSGPTASGPVEATERQGDRGEPDTLFDARPPPLSLEEDRRLFLAHAAGTAPVLDEASGSRPQELGARYSGGHLSSHMLGPPPTNDDAAAALTSAAATGLRLGNDMFHLSPHLSMSSMVGPHADGTHVGYSAAAAASRFAVQQHSSSSASAALPLSNLATLGGPSVGQHRSSAAPEAATPAEGSVAPPHYMNSGNNTGGAGSALGSGFASSLSALSSLPSYSSTSFVRAYVSDISLNLQPAIIVSALTAALNIVVVYFLQQHVLDTRDHLGLFLIGSYMVFSSYYMIYYFLERFSDSFRRIASQDKKFYIIGNLIKAGILVSITPFACVHLVKIILFDEWEGDILRNLGCIYAIPDFISMVIVRRMRWSTWIHHACVVLFNYFSIMNSYQQENVCRCVVVYAAFSSFAYCVNVLLASRFLGVSARVARVLSFVALVVYTLCCAVNWAWQVYYLRRLLTSGHDHWTVYVYMCLISLVMWDDIVLNNWLLRHARHNAYVASQHLQQHRTRPQHQHPSSDSSRILSTQPPQRTSLLQRSLHAPVSHTGAPPPPLLTPIGLPPRAP
ncbi:hypothetical protein JKF63_07736 [Porcisia hertigi]|uniref:Transmembrane protein n=1 Tax=Porcisia hertigi TaxID=2761500 RepID=A0A836LLX4_9TRYP|nr:hypothetical protein JKF63_07736 [Porcisia hertigi]